jgi:hypothetical protein
MLSVMFSYLIFGESISRIFRSRRSKSHHFLSFQVGTYTLKSVMPKALRKAASKGQMLDEKLLVIKDVPMKSLVSHSPTAHQRRVYALTQAIPQGKYLSHCKEHRTG